MGEVHSKVNVGDYADHQAEVRLLYCSQNPVSSELKSQVPEVVYFDQQIVHYFQSVSSTILRSRR